MIRRVVIANLLCIVAGLSQTNAAPTPSPSPSPQAEATPVPEPIPLDPVLSQPNLWDAAAPAGNPAANSQNDFAKALRAARFHWISVEHDGAETTEPGLTLFQIPVTESVVRFAEGKPKEITVLFYNRGDAGDISREVFNSLTEKCVKAISDFTQSKFTERGKDPANAVRAPGLIWQNDTTQFLLEYSFTKTVAIQFRAEFIRLTVTQKEKPKGLLEQSLAASAANPTMKFSGPDHVKKLANGDVAIEGIPMVDQGQKGYCVVASTERVMRYYGGKVDEHELAEIANSSAEKGTSVLAMMDSLKKLTGRLHIKVRTVEDFDQSKFIMMIDRYNHDPKRKQAGAAEINTYTDDFSDLLKQFNPDVLRDVRTKNPSEMDRFFRNVQSHINDGVPLLWSVLIGIIREPKDPAEGYGGHMRLIIGYNTSTNEIIYTDSWGLGHEFKRMPLSDAWTMTMSLHTIEPL